MREDVKRMYKEESSKSVRADVKCMYKEESSKSVRADVKCTAVVLWKQT